MHLGGSNSFFLCLGWAFFGPIGKAFELFFFVLSPILFFRFGPMYKDEKDSLREKKKGNRAIHLMNTSSKKGCLLLSFSFEGGETPIRGREKWTGLKTQNKRRTKKRHAFFFLAFFVLFVCFDLGFLPSKLRLAFFLHFDGARKVVVRFSSLASFFVIVFTRHGRLGERLLYRRLTIFVGCPALLTRADLPEFCEA